MKNTIETENGIITIIERYGKDIKIEMFDPYRDNPNVLYVKYSADSFVLKEEEKVKKLFNELESQIIQIMKFNINENIEFYKHFNIDFTLIGDSLSYTSKELFNNNYFHINWDRFVKTELKVESLEYLKGLTEEQKRFAHSF